MEIGGHLAALALVGVPVALILMPTLLLLTALTMISELGVGGAILKGLLSLHSAGWMMGALIGAIGGIGYLRSLRALTKAGHRRLRSPTGAAGKQLESAVRDLWSEMGGKPEGTPEVLWYPGLDIAAFVSHTAQSQIQVSAGLWQSLNKNNAMARAILAHEVAHLVWRDSTRFRHLSALLGAARLTLTVLSCVGALAVLGHLAVAIASAGRAGIGSALVQSVAVLMVGANWFGVFIVLGWLSVARHSSVISGLIEIRADITAATWTNGLEHFTQAFASSKGVSHSSFRERLNALFAPTLTHLPQTDRMRILQAPQLIVSPKLQYFGASLLLAFAMPLNFWAPLYLGGAGTLVPSLVLAGTAHALVIQMLTIGAPSLNAPLGLRHLIFLATFSCSSLALARINLEPVSYLFVSWFAGFGGQQMAWETLQSDTILTLQDMMRRGEFALLSIWTLPALGAACLALQRVTLRSRAVSPRTSHRIIPTVAALTCVPLAGYDPSRLRVWPDFFGNFLENLYAALGNASAILLGLPLVAAAVCLELQRGFDDSGFVRGSAK